VMRRLNALPCRRSPHHAGFRPNRGRTPGIVPAAVQLSCRYKCSPASPRFVSSSRRRNSARRVLNGVHQLSAQARAAAPAMDKQLRNLRAVRLVRCPGRVELNGPDAPFNIASDEKDGAGVGRSNAPSPPVFSAHERERREQTRGSSGLDRVDQKLREGSEIGVTHRHKQSLDHVCWLAHGWLTVDSRTIVP